MVSICPRCGNPGTRYMRKEGERVYVYFSHYDPATRKRKKCYIGPLEYKYVEMQHKLGLAGVEVTDYYEVAVTALKKYINMMMKKGEKEKDLKALEELYKNLLELRARITLTLLELEKTLKKGRRQTADL
ncbi:MAG: hypothetical protein QXT64_06905 [Desulfurococcaceae archaeon]